MHIPWNFTPKTRSILTTNHCRLYGSVYNHFLQNVSRVWNAMPDCTKKGRTEAHPRSYHQMLSNNQEIAVSSFPILWSPSRMRWCISLRGCLQPEA